MNIIELRDRLTEIIKENEKHGWVDRNASECGVRIPVSKRVTEYRTIKNASSGWLGLTNNQEEHINIFELGLSEVKATYGKNRKNDLANRRDICQTATVFHH